MEAINIVIDVDKPLKGISDVILHTLDNGLLKKGEIYPQVKKCTLWALIKYCNADLFEIAKYMGDSPQKIEALVLARFGNKVKLKNSFIEGLNVSKIS